MIGNHAFNYSLRSPDEGLSRNVALVLNFRFYKSFLYNSDDKIRAWVRLNLNNKTVVRKSRV